MMFTLSSGFLLFFTALVSGLLLPMFCSKKKKKLPDKRDRTPPETEKETMAMTTMKVKSPTQKPPSLQSAKGKKAKGKKRHKGKKGDAGDDNEDDEPIITSAFGVEVPPTTEVDSGIERTPAEAKNAAPKSPQAPPKAVKTAYTYAGKTAEERKLLKLASKAENGTPPKSKMKKVPEKSVIKVRKLSDKDKATSIIDKKMPKVPDTKGTTKRKEQPTPPPAKDKGAKKEKIVPPIKDENEEHTAKDSSQVEGVSEKRRVKQVSVSENKQTKGESEKVKDSSAKGEKVEEDEDYGDEDREKGSRKSSRQKKEKEEDSASEVKKGEDEGIKKREEEAGGNEIQAKKADESEDDGESSTPMKEDEEVD